MITESVQPPDDVFEDFTPARRTIKFKIDDDIFYAVPGLPAVTAVRFSSKAEAFEKADEETKLAILGEMFKLILVRESAARFIERLSSAENPIDAETMFKVIPWVMEQFGLRPTESSSDSLAGSESLESGKNSMVTVPVGESTSEVSH